MGSIQSKTIVLLTGAFVSHHCWDNWKPYLEARGFTTFVPPWPHKEGDAPALRSRHPDKALASLTLPELIAFYTSFISKLPEQPILIGHSFGGLLTQLLLNRGLAAAGVAIHSVPPQGVPPLELSFFRSNTKALGLFTSLDEPYLRSFESWQYAFTNGMPLSEQQASYEQLVIPESKRVLRAGLTSDAHVDFTKEHNPLLILSGSEDHCIPAALNERNFRRYKNKHSVTTYVNRPGRSHFVLGQPTWKEDAAFILDWIDKQ